MRLSSCHIDGFGIFDQVEVESLSPGLSVFHGENEAGKSTLLAFVRSVLFGFPRGNSSESKYPPVHGGVHGGRLTLAGDGGELTVERYSGRRNKLRVTLPDGSEGTQEDLDRLLGHADRKLYRSIFAFSLSELQSLESLTSEGIQERIFSAGITGAGKSAREALAQLETRSRALYGGGRRSSHRVGELLASLRDVERELAERCEVALRYPETSAQVETLAQQLTALRARSDDQRRLEARARKLQELWSEVWNPLSTDRETLAKLEDTGAFPPDGAERMERCSSHLEAAEERCAEAEEERAIAERERAGLEEDAAAAASFACVEALYGQLELYRERCERASGVRSSVAQADQLVSDCLRDLGWDWNAERLASFDHSIPRLDEVRHWKSELEGGARGLAEALQVRAVLEERLERACERERDCLRLRDELPAPDPELLSGDGRSLSELRVALAELSNAESRLHAAGARAERDAERRSRGHWGSVSLLVLALAVAGGLWLWSGDWRWAGTAGAVLGAAAVIRLGTERRRRAATRGESKAQGQACAELEEQVEGLLRRVEPLARQLALLERPSFAEVEARQQLLEQSRERLAEHRRRDDRLQLATEVVRGGTAELDSHDRRLEDLRRRVAETRASWEEWKSEAGIPEGLAPETVVEFWERVRTGREALRARHRAHEDLEGLRAAIDAWESECRRVLAAVDPDSASTDFSQAELVEGLLRLRERCLEDRSVRARGAELERRLVELAARVESRAGRLEALQRELKALLDEGGAASAEEFRRRSRIAAEHRRLEDRCGWGRGELERRLGRGKEAREMLRELESGRLSEWEREATEARAAALEAEAQRDAVLRQHQDASTELDSLRRSSALMELELRRESLYEELRATLDEWRRIQVARGLIRATLDRFERERQPTVLREASRFFSAVTGGRYSRIVQSTEGDSFAVLDAADRRKSPAELSRGTAEQLYVCIRLGLIAEFARRSVSLPVVMDDVLVNFDDARARAMAEVLRDFAADHQVLFFTCNGWTRDLLCEVDSSAELRELEAAG